MPKLISINNLITKSWQLYKQNFSLFIKIVAWLLLPFIIFSLAMLYVQNLNTWNGIIFATLTAILFVAGIWVNITLIKYINNIYTQEKPDLQKTYKESWSSFWGYVFVSILVGLITIGGFLLLIIPGIIFAVWFSFAVYFVVLQNKKTIEALKESKQLVTGYWWATLWRWIVPNLFYGIIMVAAVSLINIAIGALLGNWQLALQKEPAWWAGLISDSVSILLTPLFISIGVILYREMIKFKEQIVTPTPSEKN